MYFLAGFLGMLVLGSLAVLGTTAEARPLLAGAGLDSSDDVKPGAPSLFARLGLISAQTAEDVGGFLDDFDHGEDQLVIIYDDSETKVDPQLELRAAAENAAVTEVYLDGILVLTIPTADVPGPGSIALMCESLASDLGFG